ncbi:DUF2169 family type VI secretion system accessory protein [Nannocystis radixulma]|uniref:DUF2169 domain-containing protein n=1 Tax=Nannocystis radixulma TaxID=2995305 RepID=A0ABT5BR56_9BACT|nr:DUF2169 domain-containing protein [Nannocystis radixulma]MDC0675878.1 DUF2169 domain-containing protein [Nannocystis radixulma]
MTVVRNLTPFAALSLPLMNQRGEDVLVVLVAGRFDLPAAGRPASEPPRASADQPVPSLGDVYWGTPGVSSLRREGQAVHARPGTDIYLEGHAWAPGGRACLQGHVEVTVGACRRAAVVHGDRVWRTGLSGVVPSTAGPFVRVPIRHERCFGGPSSERNPVGVGLHERKSQAIDQPLPNFEDPRVPLRALGDRPLPQGFGPIARHWLPRRPLGGTYDAQWIETRAPLWPVDLDERFFSAAVPDLCAIPGLVGGESVRIEGVAPDGPIAFALPRVALQAKFRIGSEVFRERMALDSLYLEPDDASFTMIWRAHALAQGRLLEGAATVRALEPWEAG